jgi:hypothetical protein
MRFLQPRIERGGRREMERQKSETKGTQAASVAARESAEGSPLRGEMSGSERVNIDERDRASQIRRIFTNRERLSRRICLSVLFVFIRDIRGSSVRAANHVKRSSFPQTTTPPTEKEHGKTVFILANITRVNP